MTSTTPPTLSTDITVSATPETVYALLTDLPVLAELAEETTAMRWVSGDSARTGSVFKGDNANGRHRWTTTCTVSEATPGRAFSWRVSSGPVRIARWRYAIEPAPDGAGRVRAVDRRHCRHRGQSPGSRPSSCRARR